MSNKEALPFERPQGKLDSARVRAIAFYLPQFYPTPENDERWEPGV